MFFFKTHLLFYVSVKDQVKLRVVFCVFITSCFSNSLYKRPSFFGFFYNQPIFLTDKSNSNSSSILNVRLSNMASNLLDIVRQE